MDVVSACRKVGVSDKPHYGWLKSKVALVDLAQRDEVPVERKLLSNEDRSGSWVGQIDPVGKHRCLKSKVWIRSFNDTPLFIQDNNSTHLNQVLLKPISKVGKSKLIRSDNSCKFIVKHLQTWFRQVGIEPIQISKRLPWGNGYHERFNGKLRHEF